MTAYQLKAPMPAYTLDAGCQITVEAIDPNTGAQVTGVTMTNFTIRTPNNVDALSRTTVERAPLWVPDTVESAP